MHAIIAILAIIVIFDIKQGNGGRVTAVGFGQIQGIRASAAKTHRAEHKHAGFPVPFDFAQDKAAVHAVAVAHIAFFGKGAQLFGKGGFGVLNILARHRARDITELQTIVARVPVAFFEDMHHPVVGGSSQILADRHDGAVDDVAQIAIAVVGVAAAVFLTVFWLAVVFFFVEFFKFTVISKTPNRPRQQHFFPLAGIRHEAPFTNNAESIVFAGVSIQTGGLFVFIQFDLLYAAIQSDDCLPPREIRLSIFNIRLSQVCEGIAAGFVGVVFSFQILKEDAAARTVGVGGNRSGIHLHLAILHRSEPQRGGSQCGGRGFAVFIGVRFIDAAVCFDLRQFEFDADYSFIFIRPSTTIKKVPILVFPPIRRLDARFQLTQLKFTAFRDIFDLFFIQQVQFGVQIKGDGVVFVLMVTIILIIVIVCRINEVFFVLVVLHVLSKRRYQLIVSLWFEGALSAQIERHAQPRMILQFVNGRIVAAFVFVYIQLAVVSIFFQLVTIEGKLGSIVNFRTVAAGACAIFVAVAYQPRVSRTNPINSIIALGQLNDIKTGNLAVGRQVGRRAENDSIFFFSNNLIGIIE
ncbi:Uncharacterised protein [Neisseria meningitidis]|nr:Uncharacterised protein [Neisseria meningitidis]